MINFFTQLLDLIYKKKCYFCGNTGHNSKMCSDCIEKINFLPPKKLKYIDGVCVYSAMIYENEIKRLIRGLKYHNQKELAYFQARLMDDFWQNVDVSKNKYTLVPVPLYVKREKKRKYNHMSLVAEEFSKLSGYDVKEDLIFRTKNTKPQFNLSIKERAKNMYGAFEVKKENYHNEKILIIDDILTTGSTLSEMIKALKSSGINDITVFVTSCTDFHLC
ncbi:MAG: ComF family protein [Clostridium sp.]|nr:ComF family protein [Clostridium sp.]